MCPGASLAPAIVTWEPGISQVSNMDIGMVLWGDGVDDTLNFELKFILQMMIDAKAPHACHCPTPSPSCLLPVSAPLILPLSIVPLCKRWWRCFPSSRSRSSSRKCFGEGMVTPTSLSAVCRAKESPNAGVTLYLLPSTTGSEKGLVGTRGQLGHCLMPTVSRFKSFSGQEYQMFPVICILC